jgi:hypothetical protein
MLRQFPSGDASFAAISGRLSDRKPVFEAPAQAAAAAR